MRKQTLLAEPKFEKQCAWDDHGMRCQDDGHLSQSIVGGGPWYCRQHFASLMNWPAWRAWIRDDSQAAIDARVNKYVPRLNEESEHEWSMRCKSYVMDFVRTQRTKIPNKEWARKILDREMRGESVPTHSLKAAREVVIPREPGEDIEEAA